MILNGHISAHTDMRDLECVYDDGLVIIDLDEEPRKPRSFGGRRVIKGTCLIPPVDALIAEADGNEAVFNAIYYKHFTSPEVQLFLGAIVTFLFKGGNMAIYYPTDNEVLVYKLIEMMDYTIGVRPSFRTFNISGIFNPDFAPTWIEMIFDTDSVDPYLLLTVYPCDKPISGLLLDKFIYVLRIPGRTYQDKVDTVFRLRERLKTKQVISPFYSINNSPKYLHDD